MTQIQNSTQDPKASNLVWREQNVTAQRRAAQKGQKPCVLWFTGLSGSGKSTVANALERTLVDLSHHTYLLDGDNVRHGLNRDLGVSADDRAENIRRLGEVANLFVDAGLIVMSAFISPYREDRALVRRLVGEGTFLAVFVDTLLEVCEARDPKGLERARLPTSLALTRPMKSLKTPRSRSTRVMKRSRRV